MEVKINNNTITVVGATRSELIEFATFINGEPIPFNVAKPETVEINIPTEVTTPSLDGIKKATEVSTELNEIKECVDENDRYVNPAKLADEMGVCHQCIDYHINKKVDALPVAKREGKTRYIDRTVAKDYFAAHPITKEKAKISIEKPEKPNLDGLVGIGELAKQVGRTPSTLSWHIKHGMPVAMVYEDRRYFNVNACKEYLNNHLSENIHNSRLSHISSFTEWQKLIFAKINLKNLDRGKTCSAVFRDMKKVYGIDLDSEKRNFYKDKGMFPKSTLETAYYVQYEQKHKDNEHYENLFENLLDKYLA